MFSKKESYLYYLISANRSGKRKIKTFNPRLILCSKSKSFFSSSKVSFPTFVSGVLINHVEPKSFLSFLCKQLLDNGNLLTACFSPSGQGKALLPLTQLFIFGCL